MLIMFRVKNFASFKDEVVLDMRAVSYKDMKNHVIEVGKNKVVKTLAIYGKNASGKSNLISALYYFESFVYNQFFDAGNRDDEIDLGDRMPNVKRSTFKLGEVANNDSEFEILFSQNNKTYQYGFVIHDLPKEKKYIIKEEWLSVDDKMVFDRQQNIISFGKKYENELKKIDKQRQDRLYIGVLDYFAEGEVKNIVDEFKTYLKHKFNVHFELILEGSVKGLVSGVSFSKRIVEDEDYRRTVEKFIKVADVGIVGLSIEENKNEKMKESHPYEVKTIHNVYNDAGEVIRKEKFELNMESSGTNRYFSFIQYILNIIEEGGVFIVDEMSARLHPILTKFIVDLFQGKMNKEAQLIFTTHDISLMNRKQFRRDEIAFVEKNEKGESSLYTLADIKARSDASFAKDYMAGKYGAIPVLSDDDIYTEMVGEWLCQD
ncbi:AAA family ATPase [Eubacterium ventriosum]|uniref:AAA family ATPase n=1 Tax=Eubacterium ventriosum TaxID=39496 RepID=UPI00351FD12D